VRHVTRKYHAGVAKPIEVKLPGPADREGIVLRERVGAWVVEAWWPLGTRGGPQEVRVYPADGADPVRVAQGISMGTLARLPLVKMAADHAGLAPDADALAAEVAGAGRNLLGQEINRRGRSELFYLLIAEEYARLVAAGERTPVQVMALRLGRSTDAVRNWVRAARKMGLLTRGEGRVGGELTSKAKGLLAQLPGREPGQP
jgi:hypothetical protein